MTPDELYDALLPYFKPWVDNDGIFAFWVPVNPDICDNPHNTGGFNRISQNLREIASRIVCSS